MLQALVVAIVAALIASVILNGNTQFSNHKIVYFILLAVLAYIVILLLERFRNLF